MNSNNHLVVMAGGVGSRFWPMSTPECPKQFIDVLGVGKTLLQLTVDRFESCVPKPNIWVVTSSGYYGKVKEQLPYVADDHILLEPCRRNTAPCIAYVTWKIKSRCPDAVMAVTAADHLVIDVTEFKRAARKGLSFVASSDNIMTLGMIPNRPETGYGYIKSSGTFDGEPLKVAEFKEKPDRETAVRYVNDGRYYWNAGIFFWNARTIEAALRAYAPGIAEVFDRLAASFYTDHEQEAVNAEFPKCPNISIDYAVMEKASNVYVLPASFGWSDLGTWGSLHNQLEHDGHDNSSVGGNVKFIESSNCIVRMPEGKDVVIQGLDGYIVAESNGSLLICRLQDEQRIKDFSANLK